MPHDISTPDGEHRFKFSSERVVGKKITGIEVYADHVTLHLEDGAALRFAVDGEDIKISLPEARSKVGPNAGPDSGPNAGSKLIQ